MNRDQLISAFRTSARDWADAFLAKPNEWDTSTVILWLLEAQKEAAMRARLLHESEDAEMCRIEVQAGAATYPLHPLMYELDHISFAPQHDPAQRKPLIQVSVVELDTSMENWRSLEGTPTHVIQTDTRLRLVPRPKEAGTLHLEGYRLPVRDFGAQGLASPEIHEGHHSKLVLWALYRAFSAVGEWHSPEKADRAFREFEAYFGLTPGSDLRRHTQHDVIHTNQLW